MAVKTTREQKRKPLVTRLRSARTLVYEWRHGLRNDLDPSVVRERARFDAAYAALTEAIKMAAGSDNKERP